MRRRLLRAIVPAVTTGVAFWASHLHQGGSWLIAHPAEGATALGGIIFLLGIVVAIVDSWIGPHIGAPPLLEELRKLLNNAARYGERTSSNVEAISVEEWATHESKLVSGDIVYTLTQDLRGYDCVPVAAEAIAENLGKGVKYVYFMPSGAATKRMIESFRNVLKKYVDSDASNAWERHLKFHYTNIPAIYQFSVVERQGKTTDGHWYISRPPAEEYASTLVVVALTQEQSDQLMLFFERLLGKTRVQRSIAWIRAQEWKAAVRKLPVVD